MPLEFELTGFKELEQELDKLGASVAKRLGKAALRDGAKEIVLEAKRNLLAKTTKRTGNLEKSIGVVTGKGKYSANVLITTRTTGKFKGAHGHLIEFGTKPHDIKPRKKRWLKLGNLFLKLIKHPGSKALPFLGPALESKAEATIDRTGRKLWQLIEKEHTKT